MKVSGINKILPLFKSKVARDEEISRRAMEACEFIIAEMGADIHDDLIQKLTIIRLHVDRLERSKSDLAEIESILISMNTDMLEVAQSIRKISKRLLPIKMSEDSFQNSISLLCENLDRPGGGTIHFEPVGKEENLGSLAENYLYRIIQELIHNAIRHSSAWHIWVRLKWSKNLIIIEVEDDGTGFSKVSEFKNALQMKYNTLRMRSNVIGAKVDYQSGMKGLLVRVEYRYNNDE